MGNAKLILVVEDEQTIVFALTEKLSYAGFSVTAAKNGQEGLDLATKIQPDLIILDLLMPLMNGLTMLGKLRADTRCWHIPVLILTNFSDSEMITQAHNLGVTDYLVKTDWSLEDITKKIKERLGMEG